MPCYVVACVVANPSIRKCGNLGAFRVGGCVAPKVWPPRGAGLALLYHRFLCMPKDCHLLL